MRDDIHRLLTLPPVWKRLLRTCGRASERDNVPGRAAAAVDAGLDGLNVTFALAAAAVVESDSGALFPADWSAPTCGIESEYLKHLREAHREDPRRQDLPRVAVARLVKDRAMALVREARAQACVRAPESASEVGAVLRQAVAGVDPAAAADRFFGHALTPRRPPPQPLDIEAALPRPQ